MEDPARLYGLRRKTTYVGIGVYKEHESVMSSCGLRCPFQGFRPEAPWGILRGSLKTHCRSQCFACREAVTAAQDGDSMYVFWWFS